jgi:hypothetical protein
VLDPEGSTEVRNKANSLKSLAGGLGFEPRLAESESAVLHGSSSDAGAISAAPMRGRSRRRRPRRASSAGAMPSAFLCGADSELYPVAPRLLAKRIETGRRTLSAPAKAAMPADLAWASCKLWSKALTLRRRRSGLS